MTSLRTALSGATILGALAGIALLASNASAQPITGLYMGAGLGFNQLSDTNGSVDKLPGRSSPPLALSQSTKLKWSSGFGLVASVGYGVGNGVRLEVEGSYRTNTQKAQTVTSSSSQTTTTSSSSTGTENKYGLMANAFYDINVGERWIFPYVGAGFGYQLANWSKISISATGLDYGDGFVTTVSPKGTIGQLAYQAIVGAAFPISYVPGLSVTAEFRYMGLAGTRNYSGDGYTQYISSQYKNNTTKVHASADANTSLLFGFRYAFSPDGVSEVPVPGGPIGYVPPQPPPPVAPSVRSFLIFFDFDRADLTPRARDIVAEAVRSTARVPVTRIDVSGHADRTGSEVYNQRLSLARAEAVAQEMQRWGVPRQMIDIHSYGDTRPLVPTGGGVREPQNRRVEIVYR
jgi:outer membrane protein OmpA-like peptidoglycan-associated protein